MKDSKDPLFQLTNAQAARLLRAVANLVEKASPEELGALLKGQASLSVSKKESARTEAHTSQLDLKALAEKLLTLNSREEGHSLLLSESLARRELETLGRLLRVPILKTDNMDRLTQKIIEAAIGARLNSVAIRGDRIDRS